MLNISFLIIEGRLETISSCIDRSNICTMETCRKYPFTAKHLCAKTCNLCSPTDTFSSGITKSDHHQGQKSGNSEKHSSLLRRQGCKFLSLLAYCNDLRSKYHKRFGLKN